MGAAWVRRQTGLYPGIVCHVIAPTYADLRGVIFEGPSGLVASIPVACVKSMTYTPYPEMELWNGSTIRGFSSESPNRLRGPQSSLVWGDELAAWEHAEDCLSNIDFSTRIAHKTDDGREIQPQKFYTTTPKPLDWLKALIDKGLKLVRGTTYENKKNLAEGYFKELEQYAGTVIARQELEGELLDITEAAIIKRSWLRLWPAKDPLPWFEYIMVSLDTAFTEKTYDKKTFTADPTACSVWGVFQHERKWNLFLLECWEDFLGFPELVVRARREMKAEYGRKQNTLFKPMHGPGFHQVQVKRPDLLIIENKGSGISLRQMLLNEGIETFPYNPGRADKLSRLHAVSHLPSRGRIWLPESKSRAGQPMDWTEDFLKQVCTYAGPGTTKKDDFTDTASQAWRVFADKFVSEGVDHLLTPSKTDPEMREAVTNDAEFEYRYDEETRGPVATTVEPPYG